MVSVFIIIPLRFIIENAITKQKVFFRSLPFFWVEEIHQGLDIQ